MCPRTKGMRIDESRPYVSIMINKSGLKVFTSANQFYIMIASPNKLFFIKPRLDAHGVQVMLTHTVGYTAAFHANQVADAFVSANHCQVGSNALVCDIYQCDEPFHKSITSVTSVTSVASVASVASAKRRPLSQSKKHKSI